MGSGRAERPTGTDGPEWMINDGYRARWRGTEYEASPDGGLVRLFVDHPTKGFDRIRSDRFRRLVPLDDLEWFGYLRTVGSFRGEPVVLVAERGDQVCVEYTGGRAPTAGELGLPAAEFGVYRGWVGRGEVSGVTEQRVTGWAPPDGR